MKTSKQAGVSDSLKDTQMFLFFTLLFRTSARWIHAKDYLDTGESEFFSLFFVQGKLNYISFKLSLVFVRLLLTPYVETVAFQMLVWSMLHNFDPLFNRYLIRNFSFPPTDD